MLSGWTSEGEMTLIIIFMKAGAQPEYVSREGRSGGELFLQLLPLIRITGHWIGRFNNLNHNTSFSFI